MFSCRLCNYGKSHICGGCDVVRSGVHVVVVSLLCVGNSIGNYVRVIVVFHLSVFRGTHFSIVLFG